MTSPRKPGFVLPVAVTLAVLLGLYVGAYYSWVSPHGHPHLPYFQQAWGWPDLSIEERERRYRIIFAPILWLDRRIRPSEWE